MEIQDEVWREILQATGAIAIDRERLNMRLAGTSKAFEDAINQIVELKKEQEALRALLALKPTHTIVLDTPKSEGMPAEVYDSHEAVPDPGQ